MIVSYVPNSQIDHLIHFPASVGWRRRRATSEASRRIVINFNNYNICHPYAMKSSPIRPCAIVESTHWLHQVSSTRQRMLIVLIYLSFVTCIANAGVRRHIHLLESLPWHTFIANMIIGAPTPNDCQAFAVYGLTTTVIPRGRWLMLMCTVIVKKIATNETILLVSIRRRQSNPALWWTYVEGGGWYHLHHSHSDTTINLVTMHK